MPDHPGPFTMFGVKSGSATKERTSRDSTVRLAVSMGDPAGIGSEVILGGVVDLPDDIELTIYGDAGVLKDAAAALARAGGRGPEIDREMDLVTVSVLAERERHFGRPSIMTGEAAYRYVVAAFMAVKKGEADAMVTAPLSKQWMNAAGHNYSGHTELLAELSKAPRFAMMLAGESLRVVPVTTHIRLADVPCALSARKILDAIELTHDCLTNCHGISKPRIACAGLNPHAGEGGMMGDEEILVIAPAIEQAKAGGIDVSGPHPADALFAKRDLYDAIVCMYHDQALGPLKALHFDSAVNLTLGLPIVRTSPDHGTAFDIAGKGIAKPDSMLAAMLLAADIVRRRKAAALTGGQ